MEKIYVVHTVCEKGNFRSYVEEIPFGAELTQYINRIPGLVQSILCQSKMEAYRMSTNRNELFVKMADMADMANDEETPIVLC